MFVFIFTFIYMKTFLKHKYKFFLTKEQVIFQWEKHIYPGIGVAIS